MGVTTENGSVLNCLRKWRSHTEQVCSPGCNSLLGTVADIVLTVALLGSIRRIQVRRLVHALQRRQVVLVVLSRHLRQLTGYGHAGRKNLGMLVGRLGRKQLSKMLSVLWHLWVLLGHVGDVY